MPRSVLYRETCSSCRKAKQRGVSAARQQAASSWSTDEAASSHQQCIGDADSEPRWYRDNGPYPRYVDPYDRCAGRDWEEDLHGSAGQTNWDAPVSRAESAAPLATWDENLHGCGDVWPPNAWGREDCSRASAESHEPLPQPSVHDAEGDAWQGQDSEMPPTNGDTATDEQPEA